MSKDLPLDFSAFPKMARWSREIIITEKIDGTNAQVFITEDGDIKAGSRTRWITPEADNFGFAAWVHENRDELLKLGPGRHFGEWWGAKIQRFYGLKNRRFSLFNTLRWHDSRVEGPMLVKTDPKTGIPTFTNPAPACCGVVPVIYYGLLVPGVVEQALDILSDHGSFAEPGFMNPEGIVIFHIAANVGFKKTFEGDETGKTNPNFQV